MSTGSGRNLLITAGSDTTLQGAQASAEHIALTSGHNLTLASVQASDHYHSRQQNFSAGVSIPVYGAGTASVSISTSRDKINRDYNSVIDSDGVA